MAPTRPYTFMASYLSVSVVKHMGISELTVAVPPWLFVMLAFLVLVTYWAPLSLALPHLLGVRY
jgi:C4-dicarboxylate transporter DctM subunit